MGSRLKDIQSLLYRLITAPSGVAEGVAAERQLPPAGVSAFIRGDERLSPEDRVGIYANMYFYRLLEVLAEDYPATRAVLGEDNFHNLITGYLVEYRPTETSVMWAGKFLADFLRDHPLLERFPFVADLAMLERSTIEVFCAPDSPVLEASGMSAVPPPEWPAIKLRRIPAASILDVEWNVAEVLRAIEEKRPWNSPAREANRILVWRRNSRVSYRAIGAGESAVLSMLTRTATFGRVCRALAAELPEDNAAPVIADLTARWLADGLLTRVYARPRGGS
ncbi:MAG TPA: DNA-binding domain-containing protein [Candidatus Binataceae bacterium]|nr:DNA-binding domain-containing protein [Candidatus Binataceae bacterium]